MTENLNRAEIQRYLAVLHRLVPQLYIPKEDLDDDDSDYEDYMEVDLNVRLLYLNGGFIVKYKSITKFEVCLGKLS